MIKRKLNNSGALTLLAAGTMAVFGAFAPASAADVETVVVTGSRIPQTNLTSISPVDTITKGAFDQRGATDVIDLLNSLPQEYQNVTADFSNSTNPLTGPGGVTTADLYGLGPQRTLVLVNGRRLGLGDPNTGDPNPAPDLDQIPVPLIERVEVLTGGASATYGSDALAGVVNFIMKTDFEGIQFDGQLGADWHQNSNKAAEAALGAAGISVKSSNFDGANEDASVVIGFNSADGKGNVTGYMVYRNAEPVLQGTRDFSACLFHQNVAGPSCANSVNSNQFIVVVPADPNTNGYAVVGNQMLPWPQAGSSPPPFFDSSAYQYLSREDQRFSGGFFAHYDYANWLKPYAEFSFMDDRSHVQVGPSALFEGGNPDSPDGSFLVNCNNPFLSPQEVTTLCTNNGLLPTDFAHINIGRRNIEGGGRLSEYEHMNFRGVVGAKGDIVDSWKYDVYGSYYYTQVYQANHNYLANQHITNALQVGGTALNPFCLNGDPSCVPYNIFTQGAVTPAMLNYLYEIGTSRGTIEEQILEADVTGDLGDYGIQSPWAKDGVKVALGLSYRQDGLVFAPDQAELSNDLSGFGGASVPINDQVSVNEQYGELRAPLIQDMPFAKDVEVSAGIRFSEYSLGQAPTTWKVGGEWAPTDDIRFRSSYTVAIRAPSILELFTPQSVTNTSDVSVDPCAPTGGGTIAASATFAQCANTGVTALEYGNGLSTDTIQQCPANQCATLTGGNPQLGPEKGKTFSVGATLTPTFIDGFTGSVDFFDIKLQNLVGIIPLATTMSQCLSTGNPVFCNNITRTPLGFLFGTTIAGGGWIRGTDVNVANGETAGVGVQFNYNVDTADLGLANNGSLDFAMAGTYTTLSKTQNLPGEAFYNCAGLYGKTCNAPESRWRHQFSMTWTTPWDVTFTPSWRYIGGAILDAASNQPILHHAYGFNAAQVNVPDRSYFDIFASWQATDQLDLRAGMTNILDTDPPFLDASITKTGSPNTYPTYDLLGRTVFIAGTLKM